MAMKETNCEQVLVISNPGRVFLRPPARGKIRDETERGLPVGSRQSNIDKQEVASSGFFYKKSRVYSPIVPEVEKYIWRNNFVPIRSGLYSRTLCNPMGSDLLVSKCKFQ